MDFQSEGAIGTKDTSEWTSCRDDCTGYIVYAYAVIKPKTLRNDLAGWVVFTLDSDKVCIICLNLSSVDLTIPNIRARFIPRYFNLWDGKRWDFSTVFVNPRLWNCVFRTAIFLCLCFTYWNREIWRKWSYAPPLPLYLWITVLLEQWLSQNRALNW